MPLPSRMWRHVILFTFGTWLQGDTSGFRTRNHKIHSSGDYKVPPPKEEQEGLRIYQNSRDHEKVVLPDDLKEVVGKAVLQNLKKLGYRVNAVSMAPTHLLGSPSCLETRTTRGTSLGRESRLHRSQCGIAYPAAFGRERVE
jgi:hypothetical protein